MNLVAVARRFLVNTGKILPFTICSIVFASYAESIVSIMSDNYDVYNDYVCPSKPISMFIGSIFEYDWMTIAVLAILSVSLETCVWNKVAVLYLLVHILFKKYMEGVETDAVLVYVLSTINMAICAVLIIKGLKKLNLFGRAK